MKVAFFILLYFFARGTTALTFQKIEGIDFIVDDVNFDSEGNIYASSEDFFVNRHEIAKISSSKEILWKIHYPERLGSPWDSLVTTQNELYLYFFNRDTKLFPLAVLQPDLMALKVIEENFFDNVFTLDGHDDLLYSKQDGVYMLRSNSTTPIPVKNLEDALIQHSGDVKVDRSGNVYLALLPNQVAVINAEAQQEDKPSATIISDPDPTDFVVEDIALDENDNLWAVCTDGFKATYKKLNDGVLEIIVTDETPGTQRLLSAKDKIFVIAQYPTADNKNESIYYVTLNGEIVRIPELENINIKGYEEKNGVSDSDGNAYFYATRGVLSESLGQLILVNSDGKVAPIDIDVSNSAIVMMKLGLNDDLWIKTDYTTELKNDLYRLKKGETVPEKVDIPAAGCSEYFNDLYVNSMTKEIYLSCGDGLYVVTED